MDNIITNLVGFNFKELSLENPTPLQGGNFFTKIKYSNKGIALYLQLPQCVSKNGIITCTNKRSYIDLQYNYFETDLLNWLENLENRCRELIYEKRELWFESEMMEDDIENMFLNTYKPYNSGKYLIVRTNVPNVKNIKQQGCLIYDENENFLEYESIKNNIQIIPLLHIEGIKFTSKSFKIEFTIKQIMVLSLEDKIKNNCLIKHNNTNTNTTTNNEIKDADASKKEEEATETTEATEDEEDEEEEEEDEEEAEGEEAEEEEGEEAKEIKDNKNENNIETLDNLQEYTLDIENIESDNISLKSPKEVYYEIYKAACDKAQQFRKAALEAHLEAKNIKIKYNLDSLNDLPSFSDLLNLE
jgi:hypothetical protein